MIGERPPQELGSLRSRGWRALAARMRARLTTRALDRRLAAGHSPWASGPLMVRADELSSREGRESVARALEGLVAIAEYRPPLPRSPVRRRHVIEHAGTLRSLAARLRADEPLDVRITARLALLVWDRSSPALAGGSAPELLGPMVTVCARAIDREARAVR